MDWITRYEHGEFFSPKTASNWTKTRYLLVWQTRIRRRWHYAGRIRSARHNRSIFYLIGKQLGLILQSSFQYTDRNRAKLSEYDNEEDLLKYLRHQSFRDIVHPGFADSQGCKEKEYLILEIV